MQGHDSRAWINNTLREKKMHRRAFLKAVPALTVLAASGSSSAQQAATAPNSPAELQPIRLPKPQKDGGKSVLAALWERKTIRTVSDKPLAPQMLSNLLWAAWGVNRENGPSGRVGRTAASAHNAQEIDLYVVLPQGVYLYDAVPHRLTPVLSGDHRETAGAAPREGGAPKAPVTLVFIADVTRYGEGMKDPEMQKLCYQVTTGMIAGNVHLFAASTGLGAWFHGCNKERLGALLKLRPEQRTVYAQSVGYPAEN